MRKRFASRIATQTFNVIATMSAFENVELPMTILGKLAKKVSPPIIHSEHTYQLEQPARQQRMPARDAMQRTPGMPHATLT
jgi:hypothetical protein